MVKCEDLAYKIADLLGVSTGTVQKYIEPTKIKIEKFKGIRLYCMIYSNALIVIYNLLDTIKSINQRINLSKLDIFAISK